MKRLIVAVAVLVSAIAGRAAVIDGVAFVTIVNVSGASVHVRAASGLVGTADLVIGSNAVVKVAWDCSAGEAVLMDASLTALASVTFDDVAFRDQIWQVQAVLSGTSSATLLWHGDCGNYVQAGSGSLVSADAMAYLWRGVYLTAVLYLGAVLVRMPAAALMRHGDV